MSRRAVRGDDDAREDYRAGSIALLGRPNVGKSTLLNALMGVKLAIVTPRPQTTRNRIAGIKTTADAQFVFVDTPGICDPRRAPLGRRLVEVSRAAMREADTIALLIDSAKGLTAADRAVVAGIAAERAPAVVVLNKMDLIARPRLLPLMETMAALLPTCEVIPVSALTGENLDTLEGVLRRHLPCGVPLYGEDDLTDQSERFIAQEVVREKVFELTRDEIPYACAVVTEEFKERVSPEKAPVLYIRATILISRPSQKGIVIGRGGERLREIGTRARVDLERFFARRVFLDLYVKVESGWETNPTVLREVGL